MKSTGIVRRIDELGRVVIPKELRKTLRMLEGEQVEMFTLEENSLVLKKFSEAESAIGKIKNIVNQLYLRLKKDIAVCDRQTYFLSYGESNLTGCDITNALFELLDNRSTTLLSNNNVILFAKGNYSSPNNLLVIPLINCGDLYGGLVVISDKISTQDIALCEFCVDLICTELA